MCTDGHDHTTFDITAFGAIGDGTALCTTAVQAAIDAAAAHRGGVVSVPAGTFLIGTIFLKDGVTLDLHPAGRLLGSPRLEDYSAKSWGQHIDRTPWHLVVCAGVRDVTIRGGGTIDGNGPAFWEPCVEGPLRPADAEVPPGAFGGLHALSCVAARHAADPAKAAIAWIRANKENRPSPMIEVTDCTNLRIQDVRIANSAGWLLHLHNSRFLWIRGVRLESNLYGPNNDGFDITGCQDVMVSDCHLSCCDDAICLKTTPDSLPIERVTVTNCIIRTRCVALKFGCAESFHDFRQVTFSNCVVYESSRAVGIYTKEGGVIEDVTISNIVCESKNPFLANRPIHIDCMRQSPTSKLGRIRNVLISNVVCRTDGRLLLTGKAESPLENIVLRDIVVAYPTVDDPAPIAPRIPCGQFSPQNPEARAARAVVVAEHVKNLVVDNLIVTWPETDAQGRIQVPAGWDFPIKAVNGGFDQFFQKSEYNTGRIPDFAVLWGRNLQGGYVRAPLAEPPRAGLPVCDLAGSSIRVL